MQEKQQLLSFWLEPLAWRTFAGYRDEGEQKQVGQVESEKSMWCGEITFEMPVPEVDLWIHIEPGAQKPWSCRSRFGSHQHTERLKPQASGSWPCHPALKAEEEGAAEAEEEHQWACKSREASPSSMHPGVLHLYLTPILLCRNLLIILLESQYVILLLVLCLLPGTPYTHTYTAGIDTYTHVHTHVHTHSVSFISSL